MAALQRKSHLCIPRKGIVRPRSQFFHMYYSQDRSKYFFAAESADQLWEYVNRSQTHECGNLEYLFQIFGIVYLQYGILKVRCIIL